MKSRIAAVLAPLFVVSSIPIHAPVQADSPSDTITGLYQKGDHVKIEWSTEMPLSDVITQTGFESGDEIPNMTNGNVNPQGNQSVLDDGSGNMVLQLLDTITGRTGNSINPPDTSSTESVVRYAAKALPEDTVLSLNYRARAIDGDNNSINMVARTGWLQEGFPITDRDGNKILYAQTVDWNAPPNEILIRTGDGSPVSIDNGRAYTVVTSRDKNYNYGILRYVWNQAQQKLILSGTNVPWNDGTLLGPQPTIQKEVFNDGDEMLAHRSNSYTFPTRNPKPGEGWVTLSANVSIPNMAEYESMTKGLGLRSFWSTDGTLQVDDVRLGYATEAEVFRDSQSVYKGYLSDFEDNSAVDKAKPPEPTNVTMTPTGQDIQISWDAVADEGSTYNYKVTAYPKNGDPEESSTKSIDVKSGIKGYAVAVDNNPTFTPSTTPTTTSTSFTAPRPAGNFFIHVAAIDNEGNISSISTKQVSDADAPTASTSQNITAPTNQDVTINVIGTDADTWVKSIELPNGQKIMNNIAEYTVSQNGDYTFILEDYNGNKGSVTHTVNNIDKDPPTVSFSPALGGWVEFESSVNVSLSETASSSYSLDSGATWTPLPADGKITLGEEGDKTVIIKGSDAAGNPFEQTSPVYKVQKKPSSVNATTEVLSAYNIRVKWVPVEGQSYTITNTNTGESKNAAWPQNSADFEGLSGGTDYNLDVVIKNQVGEASESIHALTIPDAPKNLKVDPIEGDPTSASITWTPSYGADSYLVQGTQSVVSNGAIISGLQPGQMANVSVVAVNASGSSLTSSIAYLPLPDIPGDFKYANVKSNSVYLSWQEVLSAESYNLYRNTSGVASVTQSVYEDDDLDSGTEYEYEVSASNQTGEGNKSSVLKVLTLPRALGPITPTNITENEVTLNWDSLLGVDGYTASNGAASQDTSSNSYLASGLEAGTRYTFEVAGRNASGLGDSAKLSVITLPDKVSSMIISEISSDSATINADVVKGADHYKIIMGDKTFNTSTFPYKITGLSANTDYTISVVAVNESGEGKPTEDNFTTLPDVPKNLSAEDVSENGMTLTWDAVAQAKEYIVKIGEEEYKTTSNKYPATQLQPGESYMMSVRAVNDTGAGLAAEKEFSTLTTPPSIDKVKPDMYGATISWLGIKGAKEYAVLSADDKVLFKGPELTAEVVGLLDGRTNKVNLVAYNKDGLASRYTEVDILTKVGRLDKAQLKSQSNGMVEISIPDTDKVVDKYSILRDGDLVKSIKNERGATWKDTKSTKGKKYRYSIIPINASGEGLSADYDIAINADAEYEVKSPALEPIKQEPAAPPKQKPELPPVTQPEVIPEKTAFLDIKGSFAEGDIIYLEKLGIVKGTATGYFSPNKSITRMEFSALITRALKIPPDVSGSVTFEDASKNSWYYSELVAAFNNGIVDGMSAKKFAPNVNINREQATKMLVNTVQPPHNGNGLGFTDRQKVSWWAEQAVRDAVLAGLIQGFPDGSFRPLKDMTRAEAAVLIQRMIVK